jgi:hypothetical protein
MAQRRLQKTNGTAAVIVKNGTTNGTAVLVPPTSFMTRQDSRLSVKSLIESIENTSKQTKGGSQSGSTSSLNSLNAMEREDAELRESPSATEQEKQQKTLNNNSLSNNNNVNGGPKNRGRLEAMLAARKLYDDA